MSRFGKRKCVRTIRISEISSDFGDPSISLLISPLINTIHVNDVLVITWTGDSVVEEVCESVSSQNVINAKIQLLGFLMPE
jgi:hypothetical protein